MGRRADPERVAFWGDLIERRRRSGLSVADCCAEAGVSTASFYLWQRKLRGGAARPQDGSERREASRLVPVRILPAAPVGRGDSTGMLEVELPSKIQLRIPSGCDISTLQVVLSLLLAGGGREDGGC